MDPNRLSPTWYREVQTLASTLGVDGNSMSIIELQAVSQVLAGSDTSAYARAFSSAFFKCGLDYNPRTHINGRKRQNAPKQPRETNSRRHSNAGSLKSSARFPLSDPLHVFLPSQVCKSLERIKKIIKGKHIKMPYQLANVLNKNEATSESTDGDKQDFTFNIKRPSDAPVD
ncbi:hypothetical protein HNY73_007005 [Argiope bruennichi]|uniref:Uncharacterized protein n=1 Tax=Argiope bruennichi TaxID=94029 RepID=A0A8T0FJN3_ARGBR|nr:hypothetical protein HNY73_007005 [Argiope bruennichi]